MQAALTQRRNFMSGATCAGGAPFVLSSHGSAASICCLIDNAKPGSRVDDVC
jgi:hypothetical protein